MKRLLVVLTLAALTSAAGCAERRLSQPVRVVATAADARYSRVSRYQGALTARAAAKMPAERTPALDRDIHGVQRAAKGYHDAFGAARRAAKRLQGGYRGLSPKKRAAARSADVRKLAQSLEVMARRTEKMRAAFGVMRRTLLVAAGNMKPGRRKGTFVPSLDGRRTVSAAVYERVARLEIFRNKLATHAAGLRAQAARVRNHRRGGIDPRYLADSTSPFGALNFLDGRGKRRGSRP